MLHSQPSPDTDTAEAGGRLVLANARLVLQQEILTGCLTIEDGRIAAIEPGTAVPSGAIDCAGDYVSPGLVELHTDNLERHMQPRPGVAWPHDAALLAHDAELAGTGITTVFDAMRVGSVLTGHSRYVPYARELASELLDLRARNLLRISHFLHLRAEVCSESLLDELDAFGPEDRVRLVSLMDHTPGQRQFRDMEKLRAYVRGKAGISEEQWLEHVAHLRGLSDRLAAAHEAGAVAAARRYGAILASHDDTTPEQVRVSAAHGATLAEFPTTIEAARACRDAGIAVMMGAPNLVRGGSHSGNVSAVDLAREGLLDILSSDYIPAALLLAALRLASLWDDLPRAMATVTLAPARAAGLQDRGVLSAGMRADLVRFRKAGEAPQLLGVWSRGRRVG